MNSSVITEASTTLDLGNTAENLEDKKTSTFFNGERPPIVIAIGATCLAMAILIIFVSCFIGLATPIIGWLMSFSVGCIPRLKRLTRLNIALLLTLVLALFYAWMNQLSILDSTYCVHIVLNDFAFFAGCWYSIILTKQEKILLRRIKGNKTRSD